MQILHLIQINITIKYLEWFDGIYFFLDFYAMDQADK